MEEIIAAAVKSLETDIETKKEQINLLKKLNLKEPITEEEWHEICETPLRSSEIMAQLLKNIFPNAEDIIVHANYVYFNMYGFKLQIPTSRQYGINVNTLWYNSDYKTKEIFKYTQNTLSMKKYFDAVDDNANWYTLAKLRLLGSDKKYILFFRWFLKYKWKDPHREEWEKIFKQEEEDYQKRMKEHEKYVQKTIEKIFTLCNKLLPEINKFSSEHFAFDSFQGRSTTLEKILEENATLFGTVQK